jgi:hypothetical protein
VREVVIRRFCANCYRQGKRTELAPGHSEYTIVVNEFGAKTDLCDDCAHTVLVPLLEMMSAGEDLSALSRQEWAQLGSVFPRTAAIRKLNGPASIKPATPEPAASPPAAAQLVPGVAGDAVEPGDAAGSVDEVKPAKAKPRRKTALRKKAGPGRSKATAGKAHVCEGCGQTFTRAANLAIHMDHFGAQPHPRPTRRGAALIVDTAQQDAAPETPAAAQQAPPDAAQEAAVAAALQTPTTSASEDSDTIAGPKTSAERSER